MIETVQYHPMLFSEELCDQAVPLMQRILQADPESGYTESHENYEYTVLDLEKLQHAVADGVSLSWYDASLEDSARAILKITDTVRDIYEFDIDVVGLICMPRDYAVGWHTDEFNEHRVLVSLTGLTMIGQKDPLTGEKTEPEYQFAGDAYRFLTYNDPALNMPHFALTYEQEDRYAILFGERYDEYDADADRQLVERAAQKIATLQGVVELDEITESV